VDDFCQQFERLWQQHAQLPAIAEEKLSRSRMRLSEILTIVIAFHSSGQHIFKALLYPASAASLASSVP